MFGGSVLTRVNKTKFLGVIIDENLSFKHHIELISNNISNNVGILHKLKYFIPKSILYCIYCSLIMPYLSYGILVWGNTHKIYLDKLLKLQKRAVRNISKSEFRSHTAPLFKDLNLLRIYDMYTYYLCIFMFKYSINQLPSLFKDYFIKRSNVHNLNTRKNNDYQLTRNKTTFSSKGIRSTGPKYWNQLNTDIKNVKTINTFKLKLKSNILSSYT